MSSKPIIVLVPGAWATPAFYTLLSSNLSEKGLTTKIVSHPSAGAEPPIKTLDDDVSNLRSTLKRLVNSGEDAIVVAHSYGGLVASGSVQGLEKPVRQNQGKQGGIVMIVYMTAFVVNEGLNLIDVCGGQLLPWIKCDENYTTLSFDTPFHDLPQAQQSHWTSALTHTSLPVFSGTATYEPWHVIPTAYIMGEEDEMLPLAVQEHMVGVLRTSRVYRLKSSHFPFLSMSGNVAGIVQELVGEI